MTAFLIDTHLLIWSLLRAPRLSRRAVALIEDPAHRLLFSAVSIVEIAIKYAQGRPDFPVDPGITRRTLLENDYHELPLTSLHGERVGTLPPVHKDPWDRLMIAQALAEGMPFVTADASLANYPGQVIVV